jgi:hypothetical protein
MTAESVTVIPPPEKPTEDPHNSFPWWLWLLLFFPLLAIAAIIFFGFKRKKNAPAKPIPTFVQKDEPQKEKTMILEEEVIRRYAYKLYEKRYGQSEDAVVDWYQSICELTAYYEALGYRVILYWEPEAQTIREKI